MQNLILFFCFFSLPFCLSGQQNENKVRNYNHLIKKDSSLKEKEIAEAVFSSDKKNYFIDLRENTVEDIGEDILSKIPTILYSEENQKRNDERKEQYAIAIQSKFLVNSSFTFENILNSHVVEDVIGVSNTEIDGVLKKACFHLFSKNNYLPKSISLSNIKKKYIHNNDIPAIFLLNDKIIYIGDYDNFMMDENNLSQIKVDEISINKKNTHRVLIVNLLTKTEKEFEEGEPQYVKWNEEIIRTMDVIKQNIAQSININQGKKMYFIDLRGNTVDDVKKDTLFQVPVTYEIAKRENSYVTINKSLLVNSSFWVEGVLNENAVVDKVSSEMMSLNSQDHLLKPYYDITIKDDLYIPKVISFSKIKEKYSNLKDKPTLFLINEKLIITDDYDDFKVDEKNISEIEIYESFKNSTDAIDVAIINLTTGTKK